MKLIDKRTRRKNRELKRRKKNSLRQSKCSYCKDRLDKKAQHITYSRGKSKKQRGNNRNEKVAVFLLGAGAAKAWGGPLGSELNAIIRANTSFNTTDRITIGDFVFNKLEEFYGDGANVNFETFLGVLEFLVDFEFSKTNQGGTSPANTSFNSLISSLNLWVNEIKDFRIEELMPSTNEVCLFIPRDNTHCIREERSNIERVYFTMLLKHYYHIVADKIEDYVCNINGPGKLRTNNSLKKYIQHLKESGYKIRAYTTNYDRLFPKVLRDNHKVFDGFNIIDSKEYTSKYDYNIDQVLNDKDCITYYNLHGCLNWKRRYNRPQLGYRFECTPNNTHTEVDFWSMETANPGHSILPINIVTG